MLLKVADLIFPLITARDIYGDKLVMGKEEFEEMERQRQAKEDVGW